MPFPRLCDQVNAQYQPKLKASPRELFASERAYLKLLPVGVPPIYRLHQRLVDMAGYVSINSNRYSVPEEFLVLRRGAGKQGKPSSIDQEFS